MNARFAGDSAKPSVGLLSRSFRMVVLFLPLALLLLVSLRSPAETEMLLWLGTGVQAIVCLLALLAIHGNRELAGPTVIMVYVFALGLLLLGASHRNDWQIHFSQAVLLVVPLLFFAVQCLRDSGATTIRRARQLAGRLASRRDWPHDLMACRSLAEVKALREALHIDASPALELLANPRAAVRIAALAALEFRPSWRPGQPQVVLQLARRAPEPEVRAAAVCALANVDDRILIESLADLLRDSSPLVRQTATEALLWNTEHRWHWIRDAVRHALADPTCQEDGALKLAGNPLTKEAVADFHAWASEKGIIALRAALTLGVYYGQLLADRVGSEALTHLRKLLTDSHTPAMLRLELARLMNQYRELNGNDLRKLIASTMPAPVRLIAVEAMLAQGNQLEALGALHELARLPNREIALAIADLLQRRLGLDLGLPRDQAPPPIHSRMAAEVARRVLAWSAQHDVAESTPSPHEHPANYRPTGSEASSRVNL